MIISIIISFCLFLFTLLFYKLYKKKKRQLTEQLEEAKKQYIEQRKREIQKQIEENENRIKELENAISEKEREIQYLQNTKEFQLNQYQERIKQVNDTLETALKQHELIVAKDKESIDETLQEYYYSNLKDFQEQLKEAFDVQKEAIAREVDDTYAQVTVARETLDNLLAEIQDYQEKRKVINEEILRQRAINEQQDFYRINLDKNSIDDIEVLNSIRKNLHKHDSLDKLIYDTYVAKPVQEMVKRVLKGEAPSGIYKITRLKTGEIYVGKSVDVKTRWINHVKTAFGCGTIAHSILHTTMQKDGVENFTFELLEEVPKDKLTEREKYYIQFYDSKKYGLNERIG